MSAVAAATSSGGRRVGVQVPLGHPHAADVDRPRRLHRPVADARTPSTRRRCRRRGTAPSIARRRRSSPVAPGKDSAASSSPVMTSGELPTARTPPGPRHEVRRGSRRRARPTWRRTGPRSAPRSRALASAYSRDSANVRSMATGSIPAGAVDALAEPDDLHPPAATSVSAPVVRSTSATSRRIELVPQSTAATRTTPVGLSHPTPRGPPARTGPAPTSRRAGRGPRRRAG